MSLEMETQPRFPGTHRYILWRQKSYLLPRGSVSKNQRQREHTKKSVSQSKIVQHPGFIFGGKAIKNID